MNLPQLLHSLPHRTPQKGMLSVGKRVTIVAAAVLFLAMTATPANNAEQLVFSTPGA